MTETTCVATYPSPNVPPKPGSCGIPLANTEIMVSFVTLRPTLYFGPFSVLFVLTTTSMESYVGTFHFDRDILSLKVVDLETGKDVGTNARGEIYLRGPNIMKGYHNKPEATANTIDKDGWLHTGISIQYSIGVLLFEVVL